jgi:hypothetical protein
LPSFASASWVPQQTHNASHLETPHASRGDEANYFELRTFRWKTELNRLAFVIGQQADTNGERLYLAIPASFAACAKLLVRVLTFLSTTKDVIASFKACWKAAGAASPCTQLGTNLSLAKDRIDH